MPFHPVMPSRVKKFYRTNIDNCCIRMFFLYLHNYALVVYRLKNTK